MVKLHKLKGVTVAELIVGIGIMALMFSALGLKSQKPTALQSQLAADIIAEELRALRSRAQRQQMPTAMVIPRTPTGYATGYFCLEGYGPARVSRGTPFHGEMGNVFVVPGTWATGASFAAPVLDPNLDFTSWTPAHSTHHIIAFDPSGRVVSNLPTWLGKTNILVSTNAQTGSRSVGGNTYPSLNAAPIVTSVSIDQDGLVSIVDGTPDGSPLPKIRAVSSRPESGTLPPPTNWSSGNAPVLSPIEFYPPRSPSLPPDIEASIQVGKYLRLIVEAQDDDGGPLMIEWQAQRIAGGADLGKFSFQGKTRMNRVNGVWRSVWEWTPPRDVTSAVPEEFILTCSVSDPEGNVVTGQLGTSAGKIQARKDGKILFDTQRFGVRTIMSTGTDGSEPERLLDLPFDTALPSASPFGDCLVVSGWGNGLYLVNRDGSDLTLVVQPGDVGVDGEVVRDNIVNSTWSPDGSSLAFIGRDTNADPLAPTPDDIYIVKPDGSGLRKLTTASTLISTYNQAVPICWGMTGAAFDPADETNQWLLYTQIDDGAGIQTTRKFALTDGTELPIDIDLPGGPFSSTPGDPTSGPPLHSISISRDCQKIVGIEMPLYEVVTYEQDMTTGRFTNYQATGQRDTLQPGFSFDAGRITFSQVAAGGFAVYVMDADGSNKEEVSFSNQDQGASWLVGGGAIE